MNHFFIFMITTGVLQFFSLFSVGNGIRKELNTDWKFRQYKVGVWMPGTVPGTVHTDLLVNKRIEDPFFRDNEKKVQWIDKVNWEYSLLFEAGDELYGKQQQRLVFYGLDTWCDVFLNGEKLASPDNMFRTWKINITGKLKKGSNELNVRFYSPITKGLEAMEKYGMVFPASNDYSEYGGMGPVRVSVFSRKAPYHFGWDWGPRLVTSGIWRPVVIEAWDDVKIEDLFIHQPAVSKSLAQLEAEVNFSATQNGPLRIELLHKDKVIAHRDVTATTGDNRSEISFTIKNPELWWSNGLGKQPLYEFCIRIKKGEQVVAQERTTTGLRTLKLVRRKDEKGESFGFELNGVPVFAKGTNSIPNDVFLPRITRNDYEKMVRDAADANLNMIRIWGGGIYEDDYFYDLCDKYGILVWQDFMFACAMYPGNAEFLDNVRQEAIDNVIRLRNHPCIALWCGNNEIDAAWKNWGWKKGYNPAEQEHIFKAYTDVFHKILPEVVTAYTDGDDYWPSSPMSGPEINAHEIRPATSGDNHYWGVWLEKHKLEEYGKNIGRFISEYGFQSMPEFETVKKYTLPEDYNIESEIMAAHQRSGVGNLRIKEYMGWYYNVPDDFGQFLYMSQVLQAHAMRSAFEAHRRAMPYCMGSLVWQLNDCWPVASWSTTDYYHNWKAAHYAIREACKPVIVAPQADSTTLDIRVVNDRLTAVNGTYTVEILDFNGIVLNRKSGKFTGKANSPASIATLNKAELLNGHPDNEVVAVVTIEKGKTVLDKKHVYFTLPKNLNLPVPQIKTTVTEENGRKFIIAETDKLACDVMFCTPGQASAFSDNYMDLLPGKVYKIEITTATPCREIKIATKYIR